ncbi:peptide/nickel transport system permease protein [Catenulispora sp. MAP5-51]|uniref:ABC transporter permease n=1 Tax=Catenulispora sp. MAP5-51 TaxID=3156298 RepID=UPI003511FB86
MGAFIVRRLVNYLILTVVATSLAWLLAQLAFSPVDNYLGKHPQPTHQVIMNELSLRNVNPETPMWDRYIHWARGVLHGDFGVAALGESVGGDFSAKAGVTMRLVAASTVTSAIAGVSLGVWAAVRQYKFTDRFVVTASFVLLATPVYVMAILLEIGANALNNALGFTLFSYNNEYDSNAPHGIANLLSRLDHLILPTIVLTLVVMSGYTLYQRNTMLDVLNSDFLKTARSKGLTKGQAVRRHGVRTAVIPVMTLVSYGAVLSFTGAVFTETIFGWHGLGEYLVDVIGQQDVNGVTALAAFTAVLVLVAGMLSDVVSAALDPRVRL